MQIDYPVVIQKFDQVLKEKGLGAGLGSRSGTMCVEAALCYALGLPHGDDPKCVIPTLRAFKISLNDSHAWPSHAARAAGLRDLGIAQLGSLGTVGDEAFAERMRTGTIKEILPMMVFSMPSASQRMIAAAKLCQLEPTIYSAKKLAAAASATSYAAASAASAAASASAAYVAYASAASAASASAAHKILRTSAAIVLEILIDMKSPGTKWIASDAAQKLREDPK